MQQNKRVIVTGALGALGSAYVRVLVPHGYEVIGVDSKADKEGTEIKVYNRLPADHYEKLDKNDLTSVRIHRIDLAKRSKTIGDLFRGAYAVVMTAANPDPCQSADCARGNHEIDMNTIKASLENGVEVIIYLSSSWRLRGFWEGEEQITPAMSAPRTHYGENKQKTVSEMRSLSRQYPKVRFLYNDHGWYPRESVGGPPTNCPDRYLQWWVAERETQEHIIKQLEIAENSNFQGNFHGFITVSKNIPTEDALRRGHRRFILDTSPSEKLGVRHEANFYEVLPEYWKCRNIPIYMY